MTYLLLNVPFVAAGLAAAWLFDRSIFKRPESWLILLFLLVISVLFDNYLTGRPIVQYDTGKISGILVGHAPVEDFCYTLVLAFLVPSVWRRLSGKTSNETSNKDKTGRPNGPTRADT